MKAFFIKAPAMLAAAIFLASQGEAHSFSMRNSKKRSTVPDDEPLFRKEVDPRAGGKPPESGILRAELNEVDALGLGEAAIRAKEESLRDMHLPERIGSAEPNSLPSTSGSAPFHHSLPSVRPGPSYSPHQPYYSPNVATYQPTPPSPHGSYGTPYSPYHPPHEVEPLPYHPKPDPYIPKEPVLLEKRPYEVKEVRPLEIVTHPSYSSFECRGHAYDRFYADEEASCQVYHLCHSNGKQDTFQCPYGTFFNEYVGTCDHNGAAYCHSGEGYAKPDPPPPAPYHEKPSYDYGEHPGPSYHNRPQAYEPAAPYTPAPHPYPTPTPAPVSPYHSQPYHHHHSPPYHHHTTPAPYQYPADPHPYSHHPSPPEPHHQYQPQPPPPPTHYGYHSEVPYQFGGSYTPTTPAPYSHEPEGYTPFIHF